MVIVLLSRIYTEVMPSSGKSENIDNFLGKEEVVEYAQLIVLRTRCWLSGPVAINHKLVLRIGYG